MKSNPILRAPVPERDCAEATLLALRAYESCPKISF